MRRILRVVKSIVLSDAAYAALERLSADWRQPASDVLDSLLGVGPTSTSDGLLFHLLSAEFSHQRSSESRYLELLGWVAHHHRADFSDFLSRQPSGHQALLLTHEEVSAVRARHLTRQIDSTPYWAVLGLDEAVRARFVRQLLEYIGCHDETITLALRLLSLENSGHGFRLLSA